ncbi:MAG: cellulase family glycosylhydrolase [Acidisphaera sp.]|nr:cellulase family glycosylhydrolase [Acidisphaera sp.]
MPIPRRALLAAPFLASRAAVAAPPASAAHLPRWRGFNLLEKFDRAHPQPFREADFDIIAGWGFDFVRLPLHYRVWTEAPGRYDERQLAEIDQAVRWGRARGIHVDLCLHTAPGYNVGDGYAEERAAGLDLWGEGEPGEAARAQFAEQWRMFAARYRGIPAAALSFNLVNEPPEISGETYLRSARPAVEAIRREDPGRLIIADGAGGTDGGRLPVPALIPLGLAQSTRGYRPLALSHYRAPWMLGADMWPVPTWPVRNVMNQFLFGAEKPQFQSPLTLAVDLPARTALGVHIAYVSGHAQLVVGANGAREFDRTLRPTPDGGGWKRLIDTPTPGAWQALYDTDLTAELPAGTREITLEVLDGDWLTFSQLSLASPGRRIELTPGLSAWPVRQQRFTLAADGEPVPAHGAATYGRDDLWRDEILPWQRLQAQGVGVHVGEWGCNMWTPHAVALAWMRDNLANFRRAGWGWALWNLRGELGPLDSGRPDVRYEAWRGHRLDRAMLDLLRGG